MAGYKLEVETSDGTAAAYVQIEGVASKECPVSALHFDPEAVEMVRQFSQARTVKGSPFGGTDRWPGAFYDAWALLLSQESRDKSAVQQAVRKA